MKRLYYPLVDYLDETRRQKGRPNDEGLKAYLAGLSPRKLADLDITNPETLKISLRDQKPFVLNYDLASTGMSAPVIWEQTGVNGRRLAYFQDGRFEELDEEAFNKLAIKPKK